MASILNLIDIIIWPLTVLILAKMLHKPLLELIPLVKKLKYRELEIEFSKEVESLVTRIEHASSPMDSAISEDLLTNGILFSRKAKDPHEHIEDAWFVVQRGIFSLLARSGLEVPKSYGAIEIAEFLCKSGIIDKHKVDLAKDIISIRNKFYHASEAVDYQAVRTYHSAAKMFEEQLDAIKSFD